MTSGKQRRNMMSNNIYTISSSNGINAMSSGLTISGASGMSSSLAYNQGHTISLDNLVSLNSYIKKYEIVESTEDLLVLSCVWYRLRQERTVAQSQGKVFITRTPEKLFDIVLFQSITQEDRDLASSIRDHYSKKIMMLKLKDIKLTKYREELNQFIHSDGKKFQESICGLVYRLPEFYHHDKKFEDITLGCNKEIKSSGLSTSFRLTHIGTMKVDRRSYKRMEYWFKNENDNLVTVTLEPHNPLLKIWDRIILEDITLEGKYYLKKRDDFEYFSITSYNLV